jgi:hypothetical protein
VLARFLDRAHLNVIDYAVYGLAEIDSAKGRAAVSAATASADAITLVHLTYTNAVLDALPLRLSPPAQRSTESAARTLFAVRQASAGAPDSADVAERIATTSDDVDRRLKAIADLDSAGGDAARLGPLYTGYVVNTRVTDRLLKYGFLLRGHLARQSHGLCRPDDIDVANYVLEYVSEGGQSGGKYPAFPWPPPQFSSVQKIPRSYLGGANPKLEDVAARLLEAIHRAGYQHVDSPFRAIPNGFVMVAPLEQADERWQPLPPPSRWSGELQPPKGFAQLIATLFTNPPGHFRMIVLAVTPDRYVGGGAARSQAELAKYISGQNALPDTLAAEPLSDRKCFAIVYQFQKKLGITKLDPDPAPPGAEAHLALTGIMQSLRGSR